MSRSSIITQKGAEELALQTMDYLISNPEFLAGFLNHTGLTPATLKDAIKEPHFLREVMQYILSNETLLLDLSSHMQLPPQAIADAARMLGCHFE